MARRLQEALNMDTDPALSSRGEGSRTIGDVMHRDYVAISPEDLLEEACTIMRMARMRHLLVERDGRLVGLLSYRDLQDAALGGLRGDGVASDRVVQDAMVTVPYVVRPESTLRDAAHRICQLRIGCLPVVEETPGGSMLVGVVTECDLLMAAYPID